MAFCYLGSQCSMTLPSRRAATSARRNSFSASIANASPGPNVIFVSLIGWQVAGLSGLLAATLAILIPSSAFACFAGRVLTCWSHHPAAVVLRDALVPVAPGLMLASGISMVRTVDRDVVTAVFVYTTRRNPLWALASGAIVNVAALHFFRILAPLGSTHPTSSG